MRLAAFIALGIGIHNFGEGLAVGAALATGAAALATFLVVGFAIHNVSEGFGIAVPLIGRGPRVATFVWLALLAGLPAVPGVWLGSQAVSPFWIALCFGIGAGAILQVIVEVLALLARKSGPAALTSGASLAGARGRADRDVRNGDIGVSGEGGSSRLIDPVPPSPEGHRALHQQRTLRADSAWRRAWT